MKRTLLVLLVLSAAAMLAYEYRQQHGVGGLVAYGTLEARNINVGSKVGGRVMALGTQEGEKVTTGQVLVTLDDDRLAPAVRLAEAKLAAAEAELAKREHGSRSEDIAEARAAAPDSSGAAAGFRGEEVAQARAEQGRLAADATNAERRLTRSRDLLTRGMITKQGYDDALAGAEAARAAVRAAQHALAAAEGRLQAAVAVTQRTVTGTRVEDIDAARAMVSQATARLAQAKVDLAEREVRAPRAATVEVFDLRPGDLIAPNAPVARLLEVDELYVMVYVPEPRTGEVRMGQTVDIVVDAYPARIFHGKVEQIRQRAEFLPRNVQTREERVHQVIGVKVRVEDPQAKLRAGIAAEVRFARPA